VVKVIVPSALLTTGSFVSYWIAPQVAPARVGLVVTIMLAQLALMASVGKELPRVSYMTWMDCVLSLGMLICASALLFFGVAYTLAQDKEKMDRSIALDSLLRVTMPLIYFGTLTAMIIYGIEYDTRYHD
jgi:hypothetical protein